VDFVAFQGTGVQRTSAKLMDRHVRCNPDVAPGLTSGGYEDKVDVIAPINILFIGGGKF